MPSDQTHNECHDSFNIASTPYTRLLLSFHPANPPARHFPGRNDHGSLAELTPLLTVQKFYTPGQPVTKTGDVILPVNGVDDPLEASTKAGWCFLPWALGQSLALLISDP